MSAPIIATKIYIPPARSRFVLRPRLNTRLDEGLERKLTLVSAPAGFGKTTLVAEWCAAQSVRAPQKAQIAWVSLDEGDNDPSRFLTYLTAAIQTVAPKIGAGVLVALQSPQTPPIQIILATLLNEIISIPDHFILVLDDYHVIDSRAVNDAVTFLLEHLPPQMHLLIATREDPPLPLTRLRVGDQLTELRAADLRFTPAEAAEFLNRVMGLDLSEQDIAALETRTEGWVAGLQLAAISMRGRKDVTSFIEAFTGSHHFVLDYLIQEVLEQQPESVQTFLLRTSILERLCGPLCDAVMLDPAVPGQATLEYLEHANLFTVPLDDERRWYRYHHLFADLLRQRLQQSGAAAQTDERMSLAELHIRASQWYEDNGLEIGAFHHAAAANDIDRAERLIGVGRMPLHSLAAVTAILDWLDSLPKAALDARPRLWVRSATLTLMAGRTTGVEQKLQAAERGLQGAKQDDKTRDLIGQIAAIRATLALLRYQPQVAIIQSRRALELLQSDNLPFRGRALWTLGFAYQLQGDRTAARQVYTEAIGIRQASGDIYYTILATTGLGQIQESENELYPAAETYRRSLQLLSDQGPPNASEEYIGLARICYEWNDLDTAELYGRQSVELARHYDRAIDRDIIGEVFLSRLKLTRGDVGGAVAMLAQAEQSAHQRNFPLRLPEIAAVQVLTLIRQGLLTAAVQVARQYELPLSQARVLIAQNDPSSALVVLESLRQQTEVRRWADQRLKTMVLQAVAQRLEGEKERAAQTLGEALALAEPGGFVRTFLDEGIPMAQLLSETAARGILPDYIRKLLAAFGTQIPDHSSSCTPQPLVEPLSERELEILQLIAQGLSNQEIGKRLFLALDTVKGHNRRIFDKLQVQRRTEAVARARELGLL